MKRLLVLLLVAFASYSCVSQTVWKQDFDQIQSSNVIKTKSSGLIYAKSMMAVGSNMVSLDINGEILWQRKFAGIVNVLEFVELDNGDIVGVGTQQIGGADAYDAVLVFRFQDDGTAVWTTRYSLEDVNCGARCVKLDGDELVIGGWTSDALNGLGDIKGLVMRIDLDGNVLQSSQIDEQMSVADILVSGSTLICGGTRNEEVVSGYTDGYMSVFSMDTTGTVNWWKDYNFGPIQGSLAALEWDEAGNIWAVGTVNNSQVAVLELGTDGTQIQSLRINAGSNINAVDASFDATGILNIGANIELSSAQQIDYWRPCMIRVNQLMEQQIFYIWDNPNFEDLQTHSASALQDTTVLWTCASQMGTEVFKLSQQQPFPFPDCQFTQPNTTFGINDMEANDLIEVAVSDLTMTAVEGPGTGVTAYTGEFECSVGLCDVTATVVTDGVAHCAGDPFNYWVNEDFEYFEWFLDGEFISTADSGQVNFDEFGFHEIFVEVYDAQFCPAEDVISLTVYPNPEPELNVTDSAYACNGESISLQMLNADDYEFNFWYPGGINASGINLIFPGEYWVESLSEEGCTGSSDTISVIFADYPEPFLVASDTTFCANEFFTVSTQDFDSYAWSNGDSTATVQSNVPGQFAVEVSNVYGCTGISDTLIITSLPFPEPSVVASGPLTWCLSSDSTVTLSIDESYDMVEWNTSSMDSALVADASGVFWYTATNEFGCVGVSDTLTVIEWLDPTISVQDTTVALGDLCEGSIDLNISTETPEFTVEWVELPGEDGLSVNGLCTGEYTVIVTDGNGCFAAETVTIDSGVGLLELEGPQFVIFPNPVSDLLQFQGDMRVERVRIFDESGRVVLLESRNGNSVDVSKLSTGAYVIELLTSTGAFTQHLIIE